MERGSSIDQLLHAKTMQAVFQENLQSFSRAPIRVSKCKAKPVLTRRIARIGHHLVLYRLTIEVDGEEREYKALGRAPVTASETLDPQWRSLCDAAVGLPSLQPFTQVAGDVPEFEMSFAFTPIDSELPAMVHLSRADSGAMLAPYLPECRDGAQIETVDAEILQYKPANRCTLRLRIKFVGGGARTVYAKVYTGDRGERCHQQLQVVWEAASRSSALNVPEPLGYDPAHRTMYMSEVAGQSDLATWIECLEGGLQLPESVDVDRIRRCLDISLEAMDDLHRASMPLDTHTTFADEVAYIRAGLDTLGTGMCEVLSLMREAAEELEACSLPNERLAPSHGGFRHPQIVGNDELGLTIIDWDGLTLANPASNAAAFIRRLRKEPLRGHDLPSGPVMEDLAEHFRRGFRDRQPEVPAWHLSLYEAQQTLKWAVRVYRKADAEERAEIRFAVLDARRRIPAAAR